MEVIHNLGILSIRKNVNENVGFLLTNKRGSYCSFFNSHSSRYQGLFHFDEKTMEMYKFIENIELVGNSNNDSLKNGFYFAERKKGNVVEKFLMPRDFNSMIYELNFENEINIFLDCKKSYDNREWGRHYEISENDGFLVVKFTKKTDKREDSNDNIKEFELYLAIKSSADFYQKKDNWVERHYIDDEQRNSPPFKRYVWNAMRLKGSKFIFSISKSRNEAIKECKYVFDNIDELKSKEKACFFDLLNNESIKKIIKSQSVSNVIKAAYINAFNALNNLVVHDKKKSVVSEFGELASEAKLRIRLNDAHSHSTGIFAGLPWFFQFWARDSLISLKALSKMNKELAKRLLFGYLNLISNGGRLLNLTGQHKSRDLGNADAHGWLFVRCKELADEISKNKVIISSIKKSMALIKQNKNAGSEKIKEYLKNCSSIMGKKENGYHKVLYEIEASLEKSLNGLLKLYTKNNFEVNNKIETWMDTEFKDDAREGIRIEINALRLNMYKLMIELTQNQKYRVFENVLKMRLKSNFWNGKILADGLNDFTIRPNIFIAAYAYPELLTQKEWEVCFENALKSLWLDWGGLSTIDKNNPLFIDADTGEDIRSYHRGNSWFWINNLSALVLNKTNKIKFNRQIKKIIEASTEEILWKGCIGCHSELSSAKQLESGGCWSQAWSNAMFIEMVDDVFNKQRSKEA